MGLPAVQDVNIFPSPQVLPTKSEIRDNAGDKHTRECKETAEAAAGHRGDRNLHRLLQIWLHWGQRSWSDLHDLECLLPEMRSSREESMKALVSKI